VTGRAQAIAAFLRREGYGQALRAPLAGDASARRYERLRGGPAPAILMDCPPEQLDVRPFITVDGWLRDQGWSAPEILAAEPEAGLLLLEDLGDELFARVLDQGGDPELLYGAAVDLLAALQAAAPPDGRPPHDLAKMLSEASLLAEWYLPGLSAAAKARYVAILEELLPLGEVGARCLIYVDYHAENLVWLPGREELARVGLLDFQDARIGPPAYDLVSLLEDARRDVDPVLAEAMIARYLALRPELDEAAFRRAYALHGAQRNCKILGLFTRLARQDEKPRYLDHLDRVRRYLRRDLAHPALAPLRAWFDDHVELNIAS
jgi:aminoglycoside/choline kinase family phosphotransferase